MFRLNAHPRDQGELFAIACAFDRCGPEYRVDRTDHPVHVIEYVISGEGSFTAGGETTSLHGGMVYFYGPGIPHHYHTRSENPMRKLWIVFHGTNARALLVELFGKPFGALRLAAPDETFTLVETLCNEAMRRGEYAQQICDQLLRALLYTVAQSRIPEAPRAHQALLTFQSYKGHIDRHYTKMSSPFDYCATVGISSSYLCRLFKRFTGGTPGAYLTSLKLNSAAYDLVSTSQPVKAIAADLGYTDQYNFSRAFKRYFGVSPQHYREGQ